MMEAGKACVPNTSNFYINIGATIS